MKKALLAFGMLLMAASPVHADITHKISTSVQLTVDAAASQATRIGSSYSVSGSNVSATLGGLTAPSGTAAATMTAGTYTQTTAGDAFNFSESFTAGDAIPTGTTVSSGVVSLPTCIWKCHNNCWWRGWFSRW
jgi:hypothetical protein